jgi:poly(A) polymerase
MKLNNPLNLSEDYLIAVNRIFTSLGYPNLDIRYVGGCVRDFILNLPVNEIDIATPNTPGEIIKRLDDNKIKYISIGQRYGNIKAIIGCYSFDITSLRKDLSCDGRYAVVEYTNSWSEDAKRRDFTFNAMSMNPNGKVFDYFKGKADAKRGIVAFIGDAEDRIQEDFLRIVRFFRFSALYGKQKIDESILITCKKFSIYLKQISRERITIELIKILGAKNPLYVIGLMFRYEILDRMLRGSFKLIILNRLFLIETEILNIPNKFISWQLRLACIFSRNQFQKSQVLCLSNENKKIISNIYDAASEMSSIVESNNDKYFNHYLYKFGNCILGVQGFLLAYAQGQDMSNITWEKFYNKLINFKHIDFPIKTDELINIGFSEGKKLGATLDYLKKEWIESGFVLSQKDLIILSRKLQKGISGV